MSDNLTECRLCLESFKEPRLLPCSHTYCLKCLEDLTGFCASGTFKCPTCKEDILIPAGGVGNFPLNRYVEALIVKHVDSVIASKRAANKWVGALRRRQSAADIKVHLKNNVIEDVPETLDDLKERVKGMKFQAETLKTGWDIHENRLCEVTEEVTQSNTRTIDALEVIECKLIERVKEEIQRYKQDVIDAQEQQIVKLETACTDLQDKKKCIDEFLGQLDAALEDTNEADIPKVAESIKQSFTSVMKRNKVTNHQLKSYKTFGIVEHDTFNLLVTGKLKAQKRKIELPMECKQHVLANMSPTTIELVKTWETGLKSAGLNIVEYVNENILVVTGEKDDRVMIKNVDINGESYRSLKLGVNQIRGVCPMNISSTNFIIITKQNKIELRRATSGRLICELQTGDFDPCAICPSGSDSVLVASWSLSPPSSLIELQVTGSQLEHLEKKISVNMSSIIGMATSHDKEKKIVAVTSYNNDAIVGIDYRTGNQLWQIKRAEYEGEEIRPNGICSDGVSHLYVADTGLSNCRVFVVTSQGRILKKLLDTSTWCDDVTWVTESRKLVVLHKDFNEDQSISVYNVKYETKNGQI